MDQFNVMPQVPPSPNQPIHKPTNTTPPPVTPKIPDMIPQGPGGFKGRRFSFKWKYLLVIPVILIIGVLVFGYLIVAKGQTKYGKQLQDDIWHAVIENSNKENKDVEVTITYTDKGSYDFVPSNFSKPFDTYDWDDSYYAEMDRMYSFKVADPSVKFYSANYVNLSDKDNPQVDFRVDGSLSNNAKVFEGSLEYKLKPSEMYAKYNYNSNVEDLLKYLGLDTGPDPDKNQWLQKTNEYDLKSAKESMQALFGLNEDEDSKELEEYLQIIRDNRLFDIDSLKGVSMLNGKPTLHYSLKLNKERVRTVIATILNKALDDNYEADAKNFIQEITDVILEKVNVNNYEVWVGATDRKLYKSTMTIDAVSVTKAADYFEKSINDPNNPITESLTHSTSIGQAASRDAKRLADIRQLSSALELYYNDNNRYPEALNGEPVGIAPTYIASLPTAPLPADGDCDDYYNAYWYSQTNPQTYSYSFCLGEQTGGLPAGISMSSPNGIQSQRSFDPNQKSNDAYYETESDDYFESFKSAVLNTIRNLTFDAEIKIEYTAKNFGETRDVQPPIDYLTEEERYGDLMSPDVYVEEGY